MKFQPLTDIAVDTKGMSLMFLDEQPLFVYQEKTEIEAGAPKEPTKNKDGVALYSYGLMTHVSLSNGETAARMMTVKAPKTKATLIPGAMVTATGLRSTYWQNNGKSGLSFRADSISGV